MDKFLSILTISWEFIHQYWPFFVFILGFFFTRRLRGGKNAVVIPLPNKKELIIEEQGTFDEANETSRPITNENLTTTLSQSEVPPSPEVKKKVLSLVTGAPISFSKAKSLVSTFSNIQIDPTADPDGMKNVSQMHRKQNLSSKLLF